jgi:hypothetical protein
LADINEALRGRQQPLQEPPVFCTFKANGPPWERQQRRHDLATQLRDARRQAQDNVASITGDALAATLALTLKKPLAATSLTP